MPTLDNYAAALSLVTDDYAIDLSCTDFPDCPSFLAAIDEALADMLDDMIRDYITLPDWDIADDLDPKKIRAYYAANDILTYDLTDTFFASRADLDRILARPDSADLLA